MQSFERSSAGDTVRTSTKQEGTDLPLLILEDEGMMNDVINELKQLNVPVVRFKNTALANQPYNVRDPEVILYARHTDMIVFTPDVSNPSFTDITTNDTRPPAVAWRKQRNPPQVDISTNIQQGHLRLDPINRQKHSVSNGKYGHNGVIRMFQVDYLNTPNAAKEIAKKTEHYLRQASASVRQKIKDIRV